MLLVLRICAEYSTAQQEAAMGELEGRMRQDGEAARAELDTTKEEIKAEETRVFDGLRAAAGK